MLVEVWDVVDKGELHLSSVLSYPFARFSELLFALSLNSAFCAGIPRKRPAAAASPSGSGPAGAKPLNANDQSKSGGGATPTAGGADKKGSDQSTTVANDARSPKGAAAANDSKSPTAAEKESKSGAAATAQASSSSSSKPPGGPALDEMPLLDASFVDVYKGYSPVPFDSMNSSSDCL